MLILGNRHRARARMRLPTKSRAVFTMERGGDCLDLLACEGQRNGSAKTTVWLSERNEPEGFIHILAALRHAEAKFEKQANAAQQKLDSVRAVIKLLGCCGYASSFLGREL
jgi:hypothetical protein